jgi:hypothetical protein
VIAALAFAVAMNWTPYTSLEAAAHDALTDAYNCSEGRRECGGALYQARNVDGTTLYFYSKPETSDRPFGVTIHALAEPAPAGMTLVADYHNHLCLGFKEMAGVFSFMDIMANTGFHTIGYLLDGCTGNIHRFDPATDPPDDLVVHFSSGRELHVTAGHVTGWVNVYRSVK